MTRLRADLVLLTTAVIWGATFAVQKEAAAGMGALLFVGLRFWIGAAVVAPFAWREARQAKRPFERSEWLFASLMGLCLFAGAVLQQLGLETASATDGGFLTALYVILVPFLAWGLSGGAPRPRVLVAGLISVFGAWLLAGAGRVGDAWIGDGLVLAGDLAWAMMIALAPLVLHREPRPMLVSLMQNLLTGTLGVVAALGFEHSTLAGVESVWAQLLFAGAVSSGLAYTLQVVGQSYAPAAEAALIMSLESVFAALAGFLWLGERLKLVEALGCVLILASVALVEIGAFGSARPARAVRDLMESRGAQRRGDPWT